MRTKGKKKGTAVKRSGGAGAADLQPGSVTKKRDGKRPAVAARKAKQLLASGKMSAKDAKVAVQKAQAAGKPHGKRAHR